MNFSFTYLFQAISHSFKGKAKLSRGIDYIIYHSDMHMEISITYNTLHLVVVVNIVNYLKERKYN